MHNNYLDDFLDVDELPKKEGKGLPSWVSESNSSLKAYEAIESLKIEKKKFIHKHGLKSHYIKKSSYQITKSEVARIAGTSPQSLFNSVNYSNNLSKYLDDANEKLNDARLRKISNNSGGLRSKQKEELVKDLQNAIKTNNDLLVDTVDAVYEKTISKLPLDVKRKLRL